MSKIYKKFKVKAIDPLAVSPQWIIVTDDEEEIIVAKIPYFLRHPKSVAEALSSALTKSKLTLIDLI